MAVLVEDEVRAEIAVERAKGQRQRRVVERRPHALARDAARGVGLIGQRTVTGQSAHVVEVERLVRRREDRYDRRVAEGEGGEARHQPGRQRPRESLGAGHPFAQRPVNSGSRFSRKASMPSA